VLVRTSIPADVNGEPKTPQERRERVDFIAWYHQAIIDFAEKSIQTTLKYFPKEKVRTKPLPPETVRREVIKAIGSLVDRQSAEFLVGVLRIEHELKPIGWSSRISDGCGGRFLRAITSGP